MNILVTAFVHAAKIGKIMLWVKISRFGHELAYCLLYVFKRSMTLQRQGCGIIRTSYQVPLYLGPVAPLDRAPLLFGEMEFTAVLAGAAAGRATPS